MLLRILKKSNLKNKSIELYIEEEVKSVNKESNVNMLKMSLRS